VQNNVFDESLKNLSTKLKTLLHVSSKARFKQSANELRKAQSTNPLKLLQDVSIFFMLERFLILIESVSSHLIKLPKSKC